MRPVRFESPSFNKSSDLPANQMRRFFCKVFLDFVPYAVYTLPHWSFPVRLWGPQVISNSRRGETMSSSTSGIRASIWGLASRILLLAALGILLFSVPLFSQGNNARILGTVTDQSGGVISGATISIIDKDRGLARTLTTDDAGKYNAPQLLPGTYTVRVEASGFKKLERANVELGVGRSEERRVG